MRKRLIIMTMSVILLAVAITGVFIGGSMQRLQKESTTARLLDLAQLLLGESGEQPAGEAQVQLWASELNKEIQRIVTREEELRKEIDKIIAEIEIK